MEKTTRIELEFESPNEYSATVTLVRKGKSETTTFELGKAGKPSRYHNAERELQFNFKGDRTQLVELEKFITTVLNESKEELNPLPLLATPKEAG